MAFVAVSVMGCGAAARSQSAHIAGDVRACGLVRCYPEGQVGVSVRDTNDRLVGSTRSSSGGFVLKVAPGSYEVSVQTRRYLVGTASVHAIAGKTVRVDFTDRRPG